MGAAPQNTPAPAPVLAALVGKVERLDSGAYVFTNDTGFAWRRCQARLPEGQFYTFNDGEIGAHRKVQINAGALMLDPNPADAYIMQGYAMIRCVEGSKYFLVAH
jgi:hypothetical protein